MPGVATVAVSLSSAPAPGETVTVSVSTANGTAVAGTDYTALGGHHRHLRGRRDDQVRQAIPVAADRAARRAGAFSLVLSSPSAERLVADASAVVTSSVPGADQPQRRTALRARKAAIAVVRGFPRAPGSGSSDRSLPGLPYVRLTQAPRPPFKDPP